MGDLGATRESLHSVGQVMGASGSFPSTSMVGLCCSLRQAFLKYDLMICIRGFLFGDQAWFFTDLLGYRLTVGLILIVRYTQGLHTMWEGAWGATVLEPRRGS